MTISPPAGTAEPARAASSLTISEQGAFWVGVGRKPTEAGTAAEAAMYVQYQIPADLRYPLPVVMVHGGGGQGTDYLSTPDGRPGWATRFLQAGYAVYVVDRPGHGRSPYHPDVLGPLEGAAPTYEFIRWLFCDGAGRPGSQWPGSGQIGDDSALDQLMASQGPALPTFTENEEQMRRCGAELLDRIGPAVLITHSMGGPFGWLVADARPGLVKAIIAVEPIGPPFTELPGFGRLDWGLTAAPITYEPPVRDPQELRTRLRAAGADGVQDCLVQDEPVRSLPNLKGFPIAVVVADTSPFAPSGHGVADYLAQAGADAELLRLPEMGITGNGHLPMGEKNSDEVAEALMAWLGKQPAAVEEDAR
ncbi:alpha/beta hydrolase [Lentzea nigeriaca]|uniref:alpha/beta hydrolase n=1 Tax=Lentzea nigeriaca TaxID=1128665 RepID=UPI00195C8F11|nr:alpha/beta hydrolase [Lentzea nigeriaca]MBM7863673.1 pimeloyl-ACP methyl ester carboxylesterase [Lentzea nigeriaca]